MKISHIVHLAQQYHSLLVRYARIIVKNQAVAEKLVTGIFENYYEANIPLEGAALRTFFRSRLNRSCKEWQKEQFSHFSTAHKMSLN